MTLFQKVCKYNTEGLAIYSLPLPSATLFFYKIIGITKM